MPIQGRLHSNKPPAHLAGGTGTVVATLVPDPDIEIQAIEISPPKPEPLTQAKRAYKNEKEVHRAAFDLYCALGADRTLLKVSEVFAKHHNLIAAWSSAFDWTDRVKEFDKKSDVVKHIEKELKICRLQAESCIEIDENGKEKLTVAGASAEKQNLRARTFDLLQTNLEKALAAATGGSGALTKSDKPGNGNGKHPGGMMVNVIIKK